eukprot:2233172-Heterocapsa_arctica.AAC.1
MLTETLAWHSYLPLCSVTAPARSDGGPLPSGQEEHGRKWRDKATGRVPWQPDSQSTASTYVCVCVS